MPPEAEAVIDVEENDDSFDAGFSGVATADPAPAPAPANGDGEPTPAPAPADEGGDPAPAPAEPEANPDEPVTLTRKQYDELMNNVRRIDDVSGDLKKLQDSAFGRIGDITRRLQEMQTAAPRGKLEITDELVAEMAEEFPEMAKLSLGAFKKFADSIESSAPAAPAAVEVPKVDEDAIAKRVRRQVTEEVLDETHAGWREVIGLPDADDKIPETEFRKWLGAQPEEYRNRVMSTHNATTIGAAIDSFKEAQRKANERREALSAGVTPRGSGGSGSSAKSDDDEFDAGFKS